MSRLDRLIVNSFLIAVIGLVLAVGSATAGERIKFKNGHSLLVEKSRVEGEILYLTLPEGGEIGVPKALVAEIESGKQVTGRRRGAPGASPRSIPFQELPGFKRRARERDGGAPLSVRVKVPAGTVKAGQRMTVGYKYKDSIDVSDIGKEQGRGPIVALWDRDKAPVAGEGYRSSAKPRPGKKNPGKPQDLLPRIKKPGGKSSGR